jgi:glutathione synthase
MSDRLRVTESRLPAAMTLTYSSPRLADAPELCLSFSDNFLWVATAMTDKHPCRTLAVVMDPIQSINYKKDTTLALLWAAADAGFKLFYMELGDLMLCGSRARGNVRPLQVFRDPACWFRLGEPAQLPLGSIDVILMRKDPPFNMDYIYATYLLEQAEQDGALVVNKPASLRNCNEKLFAASFPQCSPALLVSSDAGALRAFQLEHQDVILKPLDGMGGRSVFRVRPGDDNLGVIIETLTDHGRHPVMAQSYLSAIKEGDKRILMIDGQPVSHCLARIPASGENRGNLAAGGRGEVRSLTDRDRWIAAQVGPELVRRGLRFVGLDVIGECLTEINVTSPTCLREIEAVTGQDLAGGLMRTIMSEIPVAGKREV